MRHGCFCKDGTVAYSVTEEVGEIVRDVYGVEAIVKRDPADRSQVRYPGSHPWSYTLDIWKPISRPAASGRQRQEIFAQNRRHAPVSAAGLSIRRRRTYRPSEGTWMTPGTTGERVCRLSLGFQEGPVESRAHPVGIASHRIRPLHKALRSACPEGDNDSGPGSTLDSKSPRIERRSR